MSPGMMTSGSRGSFYNGRAFNSSRNLNRAFSSPHGRAFTGQRNKFAVSADPDTGAHSIELGDNETATISLAEDGSLNIEVQNKPAANGNGAAAQGEPVTNARRTFASQRNNMSWEKNPDGSVLFVPDADEVLSVSGDATHASINVEPSAQMPD
jgi:hypothetical protein